MSFYDMPHTRETDMDVSWLIAEVKRIAGQTDEFDSRIKALEELYSNVPDIVKNAVATAIAPVVERMSLLENSVSSLSDQVRQLENDFDDLENRTMMALISMRAYVDSSIAGVQSWLVEYVKQWSRELPPVICPVDGMTEPLQKTLYHIYNSPNFGIKVAEFDAMNLVVSEFDDMRWTVRDFDRTAFLYYYVRNKTWMISPITGVYEDVREVVNELAELHKDGVTVQEFDAKKITVGAFDAMELTVKEFDWTHDWFDVIA